MMTEFSDRIDNATARITDNDLKTQVRSAFTTFQGSIQTPLNAPGAVPQGFVNTLDDSLVAMAELIAYELHGLQPTTTTTTTTASP